MTGAHPYRVDHGTAIPSEDPPVPADGVPVGDGRARGMHDRFRRHRADDGQRPLEHHEPFALLDDRAPSTARRGPATDARGRRSLLPLLHRRVHVHVHVAGHHADEDHQRFRMHLLHGRCGRCRVFAGQRGTRRGRGRNRHLCGAAPGEPTQGLLVNAIVDQQALTLVNDEGKPIESASADGPVRMDAAVRWFGGAWQMRALQVFPKPK